MSDAPLDLNAVFEKGLEEIGAGTRDLTALAMEAAGKLTQARVTITRLTGENARLQVENAALRRELKQAVIQLGEKSRKLTALRADVRAMITGVRDG